MVTMIYRGGKIHTIAGRVFWEYDGVSRECKSIRSAKWWIGARINYLRHWWDHLNEDIRNILG